MNMRKTESSKTGKAAVHEMLPEYRFNYEKARPNRFAAKAGRIMVTLDPDLARVFPTEQSVNKALRSIISGKRQPLKRKSVRK
ncbi:MAG: hypothetical protein HW412_889 [Bacteroidetes bacterium]|nr:hypothetical protein [Bacteroidota bacterium]